MCKMLFRHREVGNLKNIFCMFLSTWPVELQIIQISRKANKGLMCLDREIEMLGYNILYLSDPLMFVMFV